ncbi:helix-turn-helix domain-containing protein [Streptomyces griseoluteus]|uniref:helix-turn-helix domain-containing protein n=1 Tax=Streptomyces griseoluteus TaxID=29306 RepID=UPI003428A1C6
MGSANPVTDEERERVRQMHADGMGRNDIAKALGRSGRTVSEIAKGLGLSFARASQVQQATEIRRADLAARRAELAIKFHDVAERELGKVDKPHKYFDWGGKEHDYDERWQDEPTPADKRAYVSLAATASTQSLRLSPPKEEGGAGEVGSLLTNLFDQLRARHGDH